MPLTIDALKEALLFAELEAYVDRRTGEVYAFSEALGEWDQEPPDDVESVHYARMPSRNELGLGRRAALDFALEVLPEDFDEVCDIFSRKGAFRRFETFLIRRGARDRWFAFQDELEEGALRSWCENVGLALSD